MTKDISGASNALSSVFAFLDRCTEIEPENVRGIDAMKENIRGRVELKYVFFAFPSRPDQMIFKGLSLKIRAGTSVALVEQSGLGKSTIFRIVERFYEPLKSSVLIDEKDINDYNLRTLRSHIALVSREPTLFAGTIGENIAYGKEGARESKINKVSMLANVGISR